MTAPDSTFPPVPLAPASPDLLHQVERLNRELKKFVRQTRGVTGAERARLQEDMRERLESERRALLGSQQVLPGTLRRYAVTFTEVQWMLDAWIDATLHDTEDRHELRRDFLDVAERMLGEIEVLRAPDPALQSPARRPRWWSAITRGLRASAAGREQTASQWPEDPA